MSSRMFPVVVAAAAVLVLAGCVPGTPDPVETSAGPTPAPTTTVAPDPTPTPTPTAADFTRDELIELCITDSTEFDDMENRVAHTDAALVQQRELDPPWLVYIPVTDSTPGLVTENIAFLCVYGGTPEDPQREVSGALMPQTDAELAIWLSSNDLIGQT